MAIGLNYSHENFGGKLILPNYLYVLPTEFWPEQISDTSVLDQVIGEGRILHELENTNNDYRFDSSLIREILLESYPYEIGVKYLQLDIADDVDRNERLIHLFNNFFRVDYRYELSNYCQECQRQELFLRSHELETLSVYDDRRQAIVTFLNFVYMLLESQGYHQEKQALQDYAQTRLRVEYVSGITGVTSETGGVVTIEVGNNTYNTLYHELAHFVNRFFRFHYYENNEVCFDNYTKTNEGFANFVAYHITEAINSNSLEAVEEMPLDDRYFSAYIDVYATLLQHGNNDRKHNYAIVHAEMSKYDMTGFTDEKADFYYQRFYKFFHYDQHQYFYPKEMMYYLGYNEMRSVFFSATNKTELLTQCLLGKVCL